MNTKKCNGLARDYVKCFFKMKIENTKCYTKEEVVAINKHHASVGLTIYVDYSKCRENPGVRAISKLFLSSLWGKFGQSSNLDQREFISDYTSFVRKCTDPNLHPRRGRQGPQGGAWQQARSGRGMVPGPWGGH